MATLKEWLAISTREDKDQLAKATNTHRLSLHQRAAEGKSYKRKIPSEVAAQLEAASLVMHKLSDHRLPIMRREELSETCRACPYVGCKKK